MSFSSSVPPTGSLLALLLAAAPLKLAAPGFRCEGVSPRVCEAYLERFSTLLGGPRLKVTTASDIATVVGLERQRQLLGCSESGCLAELAGALGAEGLLTGSLVKTSTGWLATLKVVRTKDGGTWVQATTRARGEEELLAFLDRTATQFQEQLQPAPEAPPAARAPPPTPAPVAAPSPVAASAPAPGPTATPAPVSASAPAVAAGPTPLQRWIPAMVGGALVVGGLASYLASRGEASALRSVTTPLTATQVSDTAARGLLEERLGLGLGIAGLAGVAASVVWVLWPAPVQAAAVPVPGGAVLTLGAAW